jgi:signal transduction histidine kinase
MSDRVRMATQEDQQRDKLMALGKLSAGLAHELNNPAAAAHRGADELLDMLEQLRQADLRLCGHHLTAGQLNFLVEFERNLIRDSATAPPLGAVERSDREEELIGWLEEHGMEDGWQLAAVFAGAGIDNEQLEQVRQQVGEVALADALTRIGVQLSTNRLVTDIRTSAGRISELVGAIKEYTYMDQALVQEVDLHKGLENTLIILRHKLREKNITVTREFADNLPPLKVYGSALNQVWTNLIDNAVDAMTEGGQLRVHTRREPTHILIEIRDNGTGIAPEAQGHIFEPFYTTKAVGEGTGLGLDTVARIVRKHHGEIRLESRPGDTCFQVRLPFHQV